MTVLVTGAAGFIGHAVCQRLCRDGHEVVGIDNLNDYYDVSLKEARLATLAGFSDFQFHRIDVADREAVEGLFASHEFSRVIHLAAQAGVRYSLENPFAYADSNLRGFLTVLEGCRNRQVPHLVYASSSSVYGLNKSMPFSCEDGADHPVSLYAATKKANEMMAHSYAHLYGIPMTGLRFFTVYGPWGRPDMAPMLFASAIRKGEPIKVFNHGEMERDFTYIDDIVEGIVRVMDVVPKGEAFAGSPASSTAPYRVYNIGHGSPVALMDFIGELENSLGREAEKNFMPMQPGDVTVTWADTEDLFKATDYRPKVGIREGVEAFADWYKEYYQ
ncbi:NAD-dependent epimerase [Parasalinivibrio latis]|uniref:NAD-dependent epimerase n=1 Tax=Parasalinivibrio latis TaxID=2952610 RepID=UPI0030E0D3C6